MPAAKGSARTPLGPTDMKSIFNQNEIMKSMWNQYKLKGKWILKLKLNHCGISIKSTWNQYDIELKWIDVETILKCYEINIAFLSSDVNIINMGRM